MADKKPTAKLLRRGIFTIIALAFCLIATSCALIWATVSVDSNLFQTGEVSINLNDGQPVITERDFNFEPGISVEKSFFLENQSSCDVWYRIYFSNVKGGLADMLIVEILSGEKSILTGKIGELTKENVAAADDILLLNERKQLTIRFSLPGDVDNSAQSASLSFDILAEAVQSKNNPDKLFN